MRKYRPDLAVFYSNKQGSTNVYKTSMLDEMIIKTHGIKIDAEGSGTFTLELPKDEIETIKQGVEGIPVLNYPIIDKTFIDKEKNKTIENQNIKIDAADSGTITTEQPKEEIEDKEIETIEHEVRDIPVLNYPIIDEDIYPKKDNTLIDKLLIDIIDRLEILENKKSFTERIIKWVGDKITWR